LTSDYETILIYTVIWSTAIWLAVTFLTKPTKEEKLIQFYRKVHPGGIGWKRISSQLTDVKSDSGYLYLFINWLCGSVMVLFFLFGIGKLIFFGLNASLIYFGIAIIALIIIISNMRKIGWSKLK
jgi:hypothetical protein